MAGLVASDPVALIQRVESVLSDAGLQPGRVEIEPDGGFYVGPPVNSRRHQRTIARLLMFLGPRLQPGYELLPDVTSFLGGGWRRADLACWASRALAGDEDAARAPRLWAVEVLSADRQRDLAVKLPACLGEGAAVLLIDPLAADGWWAQVHGHGAVVTAAPGEPLPVDLPGIGSIVLDEAAIR
jgi:hypothetical protein